jgi:hypothetical protein
MRDKPVVTRLLRIAVPSLLLIAAAPSQATLIDFTISSTNPVAAGGVSAYVKSIGSSGDLTWMPFDGNKNVVPCTTLLECNNDGIGVGDDEVTYHSERVLVTFSELVNITAIHLFDLFGWNDDGVGNLPETANVQFNRPSYSSTTWVLTGSDAPSTPGAITTGYATRSGLITGVKSIEFFAGLPRNSDFAIAGIEFVSVPEPGTLARLGAGLAAAGFFGRRRPKA